MLKKSLIAAAVAGTALALSLPASAGEICYDVNVQVADQTVAQADCVATP